MTDADRIQRSVVEHVLWCREERDRLAGELAQFEAGTKCIGEPDFGASATQGSLTQIAYLRRNIEQLDRVVGSYPDVTEVRRG